MSYRGNAGELYSAAFSPDGGFLLTGGADKEAHLWAIGEGRELRRFQGHTGAAREAVFSPDSSCVLTGSEDGSARRWDVRTGRELRPYKTHSTGRPLRRFLAGWPTHRHGELRSGSTLAGSQDREETTFLPGSRVVRIPMVDSPGPFSPDGRSVITLNLSENVCFWDAVTGKKLRDVGRP